MKTYAFPNPQPVRRDLTDARSSAGSAPSGRKTILNDRRSTR
jgi:hypothetical protein